MATNLRWALCTEDLFPDVGTNGKHGHRARVSRARAVPEGQSREVNTYKIKHYIPPPPYLFGQVLSRPSLRARHDRMLQQAGHTVPPTEHSPQNSNSTQDGGSGPGDDYSVSVHRVGHQQKCKLLNL